MNVNMNVNIIDKFRFFYVCSPITCRLHTLRSTLTRENVIIHIIFVLIIFINENIWIFIFHKNVVFSPSQSYVCAMCTRMLSFNVSMQKYEKQISRAMLKKNTFVWINKNTNKLNRAAHYAQLNLINPIAKWIPTDTTHSGQMLLLIPNIFIEILINAHQTPKWWWIFSTICGCQRFELMIRFISHYRSLAHLK